MQEDYLDTGAGRVTQWTAAELALLCDMAPKRWRSEELTERFPGRTRTAIKKKLCLTRKAMGVSAKGATGGTSSTLSTNKSKPRALDRDDPGCPDDWGPRWRREAERANECFLAALRAA